VVSMSGRRKKELPKRRFRARLLAFIGLTGLLAVTAGTAAGPVSAVTAGPDDKVFVCKYVGQPGVDERLQTGQNPISVSVNSIPNYQGVGSYFADQHGRSFVLAVDNTPPGPAGDPDVSACPPPDGPDEITVPNVPVDDPCGPNNAVYGAVPPGNYSVVRNQDGSITLTANQGYVFPGGVKVVTLDPPTDSNQACPPNVIQVPAAPSFEDPCGPNNASWNVPADDAILQWDVLPNGHLVVTIVAPNTTFPGGATTHDFGTAPDSNQACPPGDVEVTPKAPTFNDPCGTADDTYTIPSKDGVKYLVNGVEKAAGTYLGTGSVTITAAALAGYKLVGQSSWSHEFTNEPCPPDEKVTICHATSAVNNPYVQLTVSVSAVDGVPGNSGNQPDHYGEHQGPIFDPAIHQNGDDWGDIIPPVPPHHSGLNWDAEGQAIWDNDCKVPDEPEEPDGTLKVATTCEAIIIGEPTDVKPQGADWEIKLDGEAIADDQIPGTFPVEPGQHTVELFVDGELVDSKTVMVKECPEPPVYDPDGDITTGCLGNSRWVLDNRGSNQSVFFEVGVTELDASSIRLVKVRAGDRKVIRYHGLEPGTVLTLGALDVRLDREVVPGPCGGDNPPPDNPDNPTPPPGLTGAPDTGMGGSDPLSNGWWLLALAGLIGLGSLVLSGRKAGASK